MQSSWCEDLVLYGMKIIVDLLNIGIFRESKSFRGTENTGARCKDGSHGVTAATCTASSKGEWVSVQLRVIVLLAARWQVDYLKNVSILPFVTKAWVKTKEVWALHSLYITIVLQREMLTICLHIFKIHILTSFWIYPLWLFRKQISIQFRSSPSMCF